MTTVSQPRYPRSISKRALLAHALTLRDRGELFDTTSDALTDVFAGSIDRFCEIALRIPPGSRVLDVGAGHGMLLALLDALGHHCVGVDYADMPERYPDVYRRRAIDFHVCNVEVDPLPFGADAFDAVVCCQVLEHFTHSHRPVMREIHRVLRPGGMLEVDVPNVASLRNRSRLLRGKNITFDYVEHYLDAEPVCYRGMSFYPARHNREFTRAELRLLLETSGFRAVDVSFLRSRRHRTGLDRLRSLGSALRDGWPSLRKSLIAFATK